MVDYKTGKFVPQRLGLRQPAGAADMLALSSPIQSGDSRRDAQLGQGRHGFVTGTASVGAVPVGSIDCEGRDLLRRTSHAAAAAVEGMRGGRYGLPPGVVCPRYCQMGPICRMRRGDGGG